MLFGWSALSNRSRFPSCCLFSKLYDVFLPCDLSVLLYRPPENLSDWHDFPSTHKVKQMVISLSSLAELSKLLFFLTYLYRLHACTYIIYGARVPVQCVMALQVYLSLIDELDGSCFIILHVHSFFVGRRTYVAFSPSCFSLLFVFVGFSQSLPYEAEHDMF